MCGRTACTLCKEDIQFATRQYSENNELPRFVEKHPWQNYTPSYNVSPSQNLPVLVKEQLLNPDGKSEALIIFPMRWGMVPYWFKGVSANEFPNFNHNCRTESVLKRPTFRGSMLTGKRCVVISDGYYEWTSSVDRNYCPKVGKVPYFIYFPNEDGIEVHEVPSQQEKFCGQDGVWKGPRLLTMAGIFDMWKSPEGTTLFSFSILTVNSSETVSKIHHRMPVVLDGVDAVKLWLNSKTVLYEEALASLKSVANLKYHQVKPVVNNSKNDTVECIKPLRTSESDKKNRGKISSSNLCQMRLDDMLEQMKKKKKTI